MFDPYWTEFEKLIDGQFVLHQPHVESRAEMIRLLQGARGFVIYSRHENWCLSAHEAASCGLPILVQDQPWSRECFGEKASYLINRECPDNVSRLREFYERAPMMSRPDLKRHSWDDVAGKIKAEYEKILKS